MKHTTARVLPGFGLSLGLTVTGLSLFVLIPIAVLFLRAMGITVDKFVAEVFSERALATYRVTIGMALLAAVVNVIIGVLIAWTLTRYSFPGKRLLDGMVDLPFALPTAVAGITLATLYGPNGWIGSLFGQIGVQIAFTPVGILLAMIFIGMPFVIRSVQPVLEEFDPTHEEAAASLGAKPSAVFRRVILPTLLPSILTGFSLALARGLGEYGSVIFIAGNLPYETEVTSLYIVAQLEEYDYQGATSISVLMLVISFLMLMALNLLHRLLPSQEGDR